MIPPRYRYPLLVSHLQADHQRHRLHRIVPSVHIVSQKQEVRVGRIAGDTEEFEKIVELAVDVTADCDGDADWLDIGLAL